MTIRIPAGPPLSRALDAQDAVSRDVTALLDETSTVLRAGAAHLLVGLVNCVYFGLARGHATLRETLTGDLGVPPAVPGLHRWLRRVVAHTLAAGDGVSIEDRDTAVLAAVCRELSVCVETPPDELTLFSLIDRGPLPGAYRFLLRLEETMGRHEGLVGDEAAAMARVLETVRALELHPWVPITTPAAAVAQAGRATAAALVLVDDATGAQRMPIRLQLARLNTGPLGAMDRPVRPVTTAGMDLPF